MANPTPAKPETKPADQKSVRLPPMLRAPDARERIQKLLGVKDIAGIVTRLLIDGKEGVQEVAKERLTCLGCGWSTPGRLDSVAHVCDPNAFREAALNEDGLLVHVPPDARRSNQYGLFVWRDPSGDYFMEEVYVGPRGIQRKRLCGPESFGYIEERLVDEAVEKLA
jgi:hypothetical protein